MLRLHYNNKRGKQGGVLSFSRDSWGGQLFLQRKNKSGKKNLECCGEGGVAGKKENRIIRIERTPS